MEFEEKLNELYIEIAQKIDEMIPVDWSSFYFNAEIKDGGGVYFFYRLPNNPEELNYCYYIPDKFKVERNIYEDLEDELFSLAVKLQQLFIDNQQEPWYSFVMIVNDKRNMQAEFNYVDWEESEFGPSATRDYFLYKYLGVIFENANDLNLMLQMNEYEENQ